MNDIEAARARRQQRCAVRGHDYTSQWRGTCRRCHLEVAAHG